MNYLIVRLIVIAVLILAVIAAMLLGLDTNVGVPIVTALVGVIIGGGGAVAEIQKRDE